MLKALLKKELRMITAGITTNRKTNMKRSTLGIIGISLLFALVFLSLGFAASGYAHVFVDMLIPEKTWLYMALMGLAALLFGLLGSVFSTYTTLYKAKDSELLLAMPIPPEKLLASKATTVYLTSLLFCALVLIPAYIVYWINVPAGSLTIASIVFSLLLVLLMALLVTALACILGWLVALVVGLFPNKQAVTVVATIAFLGVYYFFYFQVGKILNKMVMSLGKIEEAISGYAFPIAKFGQGAAGNLVAFLIFAAIAIGLFAIVYYVLSRSFIKILTKTEKQHTKVYVAKRVKAQGSFAALLCKEFKRYLGSAAYMLNGSMGTLFMVLAIIALIVFSQDIKNFIAMLTIGEGLSGMEFLKYIPLSIGAIMCFLASNNILTAPSISLEAKNLWLTKSLPVDTMKIFEAKLGLHILLTAVPGLILLAIVTILLNMSAIDIVYCLLLFIFFVLFTAAIGLAIGLKMPNMNWTNETYAVKQGGAVFLAMFGSWVLLIGLGALYIFVLRDKIEPTTYLQMLIGLFAAGTVGTYLWLKGPGVKTFKEL